jgi:fructokinase
MNYDVAAMGELLIDFTPYGKSEQGNEILEANPGGAPCNVLAMLQKLGRKTAFLGKVGYDSFGTLLRKTISEIGIDDTGLITDPKIHTTLAFVHLDEQGDRTFSFCRNPGADMMLASSELREDIIRHSKIFHFGSLSMTAPLIRETTKKALEIAKQSGCVISFDPNLRPPLWDDLQTAKEMICYGIGQCDILKISDDELEFVTGIHEIPTAAKQLQKDYPNIKVLFVTLGKNGSSFYYGDQSGQQQTFQSVKTIDTTGAGDTFCGCMLNALLDKDLDHLSYDDLMEAITFGNAASSLVTTKKGAIKSMPNKEEILSLIKSEQK